MSTLPSATTTLSTAAIAPASGTDLICVIAAVPTNADSTPRLFSSTAALLAQHGYNEGLEYVALHHQETRKPVLFVGLPIVTEGTVGRVNQSGNSGTSVVTVAASAGGSYAEVSGVLKVTTGGTIGTTQIMLSLSLDGGRSYKPVRLGTANTYTVPNVNQVISFAAGTLVAGETALTWTSTAPMWDSAGMTAARTALTAQQKAMRSWLVIGDAANATVAGYVVTEVNAYETSAKRFDGARVQLRDRLPYAALSQVRARMTGSPTLTFADADPDTITRSAGSWITDGFAAGDTVTIVDSTDNDDSYVIESLTATVLTLASGEALTAEVATAGITATATPTLTFLEVSTTGDTLTRSRGSWLDDGFRVGDKPVVTGTASNNVTAAVGITTLTATVMTFDTTDLANETIGSYGITITAGETKAQHVATLDAAFASISSQRRVNLWHGRARKQSPITGYLMRRPGQWAASLREYRHDVHVPSWRKADGPLDGWDLEDADGNLVEHDERVDGGALAAGFSCLRSWGNGPEGTFVARDITREAAGSLLRHQHNMWVANIMCRIVQATTENFAGQTPALNSDGTATAAALNKLAEQVNTSLRIALLESRGEGPRASDAYWTPSTDDVLNIEDANITGVGTLLLNGTIVTVTTSVRIPTAGAA